MKYVMLNNKLSQLKPKTITVDIFDTLLLRRAKPEQSRFLELAQLFADEIHNAGLEASAHYIYEQRLYIGSSLRAANAKSGYDYETKFADIFTTLILDTARRQKKHMSQRVITTLVAKLLQIELDYEKTQLYVNKPLLKVLEKAKSNGAKVYYVSDMYLESTELNILLKHFKITVLAGGISSADTLYGKSSGRSFTELASKHPRISLGDTLHIGDNRQPDVVLPKKMGVQTAYLRMPLHRCKIWAGQLWYGVGLKLRRWSEHNVQTKLQNQELTKYFTKRKMTTHKEAQYIGWLFTPALIYYLHQLGLRAIASKSLIVFVTSESTELNRLYRMLGFKNAKMLPRLSRTALVQAYASVLTSQGYELSEIVPMVKKILRRRSTLSALAVLGIVSPSSQKHNLLGVKSLRLEALNTIDTRAAQKLWQKQLRTIFKDWRALRAGVQDVIIADIGWNDTVQILLTEVLQSKGVKTDKICGMYLGRTGTNIFSDKISTESEGVVFDSLGSKDGKYFYQPEVWESFINSDNVGNTTRDDILAGVEQAIDYYNGSMLSAEQFWSYNRSLLLGALRRPSRRIVEVMASLYFDYGTADEPIVPLVDVTTRRLKMYRWLLLDRARFRSFYFHQGWKWGAATYYGFRIPYRLWRRKTGKPSF